MSFDETNFPELPPSWTSVSVDQAYELVTVKDKIQAKSYLESGGLAVVDQGSALVGGYTNATSAAIQTNLPVVVFGDHTRAIKYIDFPFAAGADGIKVLRPAPCLLPRLFFHFLKAIRLPDKGYARHFQFLRTARIAVPPLNEQKRIADKLDTVLVRVDACRERLDRVPAILKRFRQSVLAAATSGKLTEEWREQRGATEWQPTTVQGIAAEVFDGPFGSHLKSKDYSEDGVRVVRLENIGWLNFIADKETFISKEKYQALRKHTLKARDVLFSSFIAEEVRVCLLPAELSDKAINKADCFCVRTDATACDPAFLTMRLACQSTFVALEEEVHGATRPRINLRQLKEFTFDLPSVAEQKEIVRRVESLFAYADRLEARYTAARAQVERLTPALLAKAFRGELVPQDPNDEPASMLLERIRAAREAVPAKSRQCKGNS